MRIFITYLPLTPVLYRQKHYNLYVCVFKQIAYLYYDFVKMLYH